MIKPLNKDFVWFFRSDYLDGLYLYQIETLFSAGIDDNINAINQVMKVTQGLIDAWKEETGL